MSNAETGRKTYESARQEYIARIQIRDNILIAFLGAVATVFGVALGTAAKPEILLVVPYLSLGAAVLVMHHHEAIHAIALFLISELKPFLVGIKADAPQWDDSRSLKLFLPKSNWLRTLGYMLLIIVPAIGSLVITFHNQGVLWLKLLWWFGVLISGVSIFLVIVNHRGLKKWIDTLNQKCGSDRPSNPYEAPGRQGVDGP